MADTTVMRLSLFFRLVACFALTFASVGAPADDVVAADIDCLSCHARSDDNPIHSVLMSKHGAGNHRADVCVGCHGASAEHQRQPTQQVPDISFGPAHPAEKSAQNAACQHCHNGSAHAFWNGSGHEQADVGCADCHRAHTRVDAVLTGEQQVDACFRCHRQIQAKAQLPSRHPILEGRSACTQCHNPHGSSTTAQLRQPTLNDTCYQCHQEKRGPFLFEHAPASEDCSLCHDPHGSMNSALLTVRGPFLCQQCHAAAFHPSQVADGSGLPGANTNQNLLGKNCLNCHAQVHGSNHPSGARLTR